MLDEVNGVPLFQQLKSILLDQIERRRFPGGEVPGEAALCKLYQVSRSTARRALAELEREGRVYRIQGKGIFVAQEKVEHRLPNFYSFTEEFRRRGWVPSTKVSEFVQAVPEEHIALNLGIPPEEETFRFTRHRYADSVLMAVETTWLPQRYFPGLTREMLERSPLYDIMRDIYGIVPVSAQQWFGASIVQKGSGNLFQTSSDIAVLDMERFASDGEKVIEYTHTLARGDRFRFQIDLN